ncbi:hypothetical protein GCM10007423_36650 [Dyadobacter endophyticus]|uniref:DNA 3'-5' helicase II n=1 Tax=Dyadobacter endophyticus TaxID=1749036 RepID=A0ABQ1YY89_9BACT|nr:ATP-binding domain-containing protein [Dyadobacter endophyticus]GGH41082.1 hypothetical protein GCM10007423_36650 [Dyadobacter endophyticus]
MEFLAGNIESADNPFEKTVWDSLCTIFEPYEGILGYKIPSLGFKENEIPSFIVRSKSFGILILDLVTEKVIEFDEDNEFWKTTDEEYIYSRDLSLNIYSKELENSLKKNPTLFNIRTEQWNDDIVISKILMFADNTDEEIAELESSNGNPLVNSRWLLDDLSTELNQIISSGDISLSESTIDLIDSVLEGSNIFSKVIRKKVVAAPSNMNEFIKKSLDYTFKLDKTQRQVALQIPSGPQRIRGLAGTGKTVILCMKAAIAHKTLTDYGIDHKILFVFNTQSMYNQVKAAITEYYFNIAKAMPNWNNLHVFHAWGGSNKPGVYYNTANAAGARVLNFMNVKGSENPLDAVYSDLINTAKDKIVPYYDMVLIDEAQDFSPAFFETIFYLTKPVDSDPTHRKIIWAYDEFQSLTELKIAQPEELFGKRSNGIPNMPNSVLEGSYKGNIDKDFVLPNSYRNPRINLLVAHGLALGLYSKDSKVPMDDRGDWIARGYQVNSPATQKFVEGDFVHVERPEKYSKNVLERLLRDADSPEAKLVDFKKFDRVGTELTEVVSKIENLINVQKVEPEEIIVIDLDKKNSQRNFEYIRQQLDIKNIKAITPGYIESTDSFKEPGFVTLSTAFRAKGNEANVVFIINTQRVINDLTARMRNAIFVSITRSRGWCYLSGNGRGTDELEEEITQIVKDSPAFKFIFPNEAQIQRKLVIIQSTKNVEKADKEIDALLSDDTFRALLIEKIAQNPELVKDIAGLNKTEQNGD